MIKKILVFLFCFPAVIAFSWTAHDTLTYYILNPYLTEFSYEVEITPYIYSAFEKGRIYNTSKLRLYDYIGSEDYIPEPDRSIFKPVFYNAPPKDGKIPAWQILVVYSYEPDLGMDSNLHLTSKQKFTGGSHGWRHMEYRIGPMRFGEGSKSVLYFTKLSKIAENLDDEYWRLRFMARAIHYFEDLGVPFHNLPAPLDEILKVITDFDKYAEKFTLYHFTYEYYVGYRLWNRYPMFVNAIENATPMKITNLKRSIEDLMSYSRGKIREVYEEVGNILTTKSNYKTRELSALFIEEYAQSGKTKKIDKITSQILATVSSYIKGYLEYMGFQLGY